MAINFGRVCGLKVRVSGSDLDLSEMRIAFDITKSSTGFPNVAKILVYNLSDDTRGRISEEFQSIELTAGYEDSSGIIFKGDIQNVFHRRVQPEWVTEIYAKDGFERYTEAYTNVSYGNNVSLGQIINDLRKDMNIDVGEISINLEDKKLNGWTFTGKTALALTQLARDFGFNWGIQTNRLHIIPNIKVLSGKIQKISPQTGMIESPVVTERGADVKTLLRWDMIPNQWVKIVSDSQLVKFQNIPFAPNIKDRIAVADGNYVARKIVHSGDTRGQEWYTSIEGYIYNAE